MESNPSSDWVESLKAQAAESTQPIADSRQISHELHLAIARRVGRALLSLVDDPELIAHDTTGAVVKRASETILSPSCKLDNEQLEKLKPHERQLAVFKSRAWPLNQLPEQDRAAVQVRSRDLDWLAEEDNPSPEQIATVLVLGNDAALEHLVSRHHLEPGQQQLAFVRGGTRTRSELLKQEGFQLTATDRQLVLDDGQDENVALLLQRYHHCLTPHQWRQALAVGGDATLSEMARQGRLTDPEDRQVEVALAAGGDDTLSELVSRGDLREDELTIAIYLGGYNTLSALVDQRQQLTKQQLALIRLLAKRRNLPWLLQRLGQDPGPDDPGPRPDPGPGGSSGGDPGPVGARPGPSPDSLAASLELDGPGLDDLPPELVKFVQPGELDPADDETVGV